MKPFKPASKKSTSPIDEELFIRAARAYALKRFPNPDRKGCPSGEVIAAMARREISLSNVRVHAEHIATCSPCLSEYRAARERWKRRRRHIAAILATAGLAVAIAGITWLRSRVPSPSPPLPPVVKQGQPEAQEQIATLDLRPLDPRRGEEARQAPAPVLARANLRLAILLPAGSDGGNYQFEIRDEQDSAQIRGNGLAVIRNYVTSIETSLDLRSLNPGRFTFAIRRAEESGWRSYRIKVQ